MRILLFVLLCFMGPYQLLWADPIRLVRIETGINNHILTGVMREVYRRAGIEVEITDFPAERAQDMIRMGQADGEVARVATYGAGRRDLIRLDPPINTLLTTAFIRHDNPLQITGPEALETLRVGIVRGIVHAENIAQNAGTLERVATIKQLMQMLDSGRIDVAIHSRMVGELELARAGLTTITSLPTVLGRRDSHHFLRAEFAEEAYTLERVLNQMIASGAFARLLDQEREVFIKNYVASEGKF